MILASSNLQQKFGREKDRNRGKFIGSNLVTFCYKRLEKFTLCKSVTLEVTFIVYFKPIESGNGKINFSLWQHFQNVNTERTELILIKTNCCFIIYFNSYYIYFTSD